MNIIITCTFIITSKKFIIYMQTYYKSRQQKHQLEETKKVVKLKQKELAIW